MFTTKPSFWDQQMYEISLTEEGYDIVTQEGPVNSSFGVVPSRVLGISFPDFLVWLTQNYEVTITGKGKKYPSYHFHKKSEAVKFAEKLNKVWRIISQEKLICKF